MWPYRKSNVRVRAWPPSRSGADWPVFARSKGTVTIGAPDRDPRIVTAPAEPSELELRALYGDR